MNNICLQLLVLSDCHKNTGDDSDEAKIGDEETKSGVVSTLASWYESPDSNPDLDLLM